MRLGEPVLGLTWAREGDDGEPVYDLPSVTIADVRRAADGTYQLRYLGSDAWVDTFTSRKRLAHSIGTRRAAKAIIAALAGGAVAGPLVTGVCDRHRRHGYLAADGWFVHDVGRKRCDSTVKPD